MKKIKLTIVSALILSMTYSCSDEIDNLEPFTSVNPIDFLQGTTEFQTAVDGMYNQLFGYYSAPGSALQGIPDILSDNAILVTTGRRSNEAYFDYEYTAATGGAINLYFSQAYNAINISNIVVSQIDRLEASETRDNILGQALAGRAWAHFDLARIYGPIPTQSSDAINALGVSYIKVEDGDVNFEEPAPIFPERESIGSNYEEILEDLITASTLISESNSEGRLTRNGVFALLSRVYLYLGQYQNAIDAANEVTTALATQDDLENIYIDASNDGIVIELSVNTAGPEANFNNVGVIYSQGSIEAGEITNTISEYAVDFEFLNSISDDDARKNVIQFDSANGDAEHNGIRKFLGEAGQVNGRLDIKVMRAAEVLLNKAEAEFELGLEGSALTTLDLLRAQRYTPFTPGTETGQALEDAIQFERRVELAFEGHRFFDLKRRGEAIQRSSFGDLRDGSGTPAETQTIPSGDFRFQFPIPIAEINANPNYTQNTGY
ncbi:RagB/SusD family nutrient uptake outer membrane protein [Dokdonia pacifica]|uniref:Starch-binding associating with outer membrane n=1 Tax=Dokdonia pacifica TaxID=1627892 RepID=A0A239CFS1_9FLAO|nr:RagB/SusD family nutrient uptake outer membrane protein [Dokdonia pacifica]SNS18173.1 Starch-binding associating with outer membrane [Dokdonia pacifica]